jgi:hypothetical protein
LTLNADGANNDIIFQSNGTTKATLDQDGVLTTTGSVQVAEGSSLKFGGNNARILGDSSNNRVQFHVAGYEQVRLQNGLFRIGNVESSQDDGKLSVSETKNYSSGIARQQINVRDNQAYTVTDNGGAIAFSGKYNSSAYTTFAQVEGVKANNTDGNYQGGLKFAARANGSSMNTVGRWDADGIKFGTDTAASNALSDYEEGVHTATLTMGSGTAALSNNELAYTKVGRVVHLSGQVRVGSVSSPDGSMQISLPFASLSGNTGLSAGNYRTYNVDTPNDGTNAVLTTDAGTALANFEWSRDGATSTNDRATENGYFLIGLTYFTA